MCTGLAHQWGFRHQLEISLDGRCQGRVEAKAAQQAFDQLPGFNSPESLGVGALQNGVEQEASAHPTRQLGEKDRLRLSDARSATRPGRLLVVPSEAREARDTGGVTEPPCLLACAESIARGLARARSRPFAVRGATTRRPPGSSDERLDVLPYPIVIGFVGAI